MLNLPAYYKQYEGIPLDGVYKALRHKDPAECVVVAMRTLKQKNDFIKYECKEKSSAEACKLGIEGKKAFCEGSFQTALVQYNNALMRAPLTSEAIKLTYYSRAELFLKVKHYSACVKDIETCLALNCKDSLVEKLLEMKAEASRYEWKVPVVHKQDSNKFIEDFFKLKGPPNPDIPCATTDVEVIMESGQPKVVAARDIPVGTVLAMETAFIASANLLNESMSCCYCLKMNFNLMPCEGCCDVMFCDKKCKDKAMEEGHNFECKIMKLLIDEIRPTVKATLKIRQLCSSWDEFITASNDLGVDRMKNSTFAEIFGSEKFSLLNSHHDKHFKYGALFNRCMYLANIIHYMDTRTSFLPDSPDHKSAAIRAVARVMMYLSLYCTPVALHQFTYVCTEERATLHSYPNHGYFALIGNLAHSCLPNCYVVALRNSAAVITTAPLEKGTEINFSYIMPHWLEIIKSKPLKRAQGLVVNYKTVCKDCNICSGSVNVLKNIPLTDTQHKVYKKFTKHYKSPFESLPENIETDFKVMCNLLSVLKDAPYSKEYEDAYASFVQYIMYIVEVIFPNVNMTKCG